MLGQFSGEHTPSTQSSAKAMGTLHTLAKAIGVNLLEQIWAVRGKPSLDMRVQVLGAGQACHGACVRHQIT
jgi:hypothetical protein